MVYSPSTIHSEKNVPESRVIFNEPDAPVKAPEEAPEPAPVAPSPAKTPAAVVAEAPSTPVESAAPAAGPALTVGARVQVNYRSSGNYFPGMISAVTDGGAKFSIAYDDGETEDRVVSQRHPTSLHRPPPAPTSPRQPPPTSTNLH